MQEEIDLWRLAAGLGLFLFGMHQLEQALQQLAGRRFKQFLRQHTAHPVKGVLAGAFSTAALQSSSIVSLIVLAFVGSGIISLASAIGIVFGSNLGTTATGWIVATVGFKLDLEALALPLVALGGFGVVWSAKGTRRAGLSQLVVGFGLMLMGLGFMKSGAISATALLDPQAMRAYPLVVFLLTGFLLTAVIQSSSATIMITLSALHAAVIPLSSAAAIAIGADLGTTITALLGALAGSAAKKRVAAALILFNVTTDAFAFMLLGPFLYVVGNILNISDPLFALVAFHSLFNLFGILMFLPAIGFLSRRLERGFTSSARTLLRHIRPGDIAVPEVAIENMNRETLRLIDQAAALNQISFRLPPGRTFYDSREDRAGVRVFEPGANHDECYAEIKRLEGEILSFALRLQRESLEPDESERLGQIIPSLRNAVHAAKSMKDTHHDLRVFRESVNDHFNAYFKYFRDAVDEYYEVFSTLRQANLPALRFAAMVELKNKSDTLHAGMHGRIFREVAEAALSELEISTLLNVNRELYTSNQSLNAALADALLDSGAAADFESIPATA